MPLVCNPGTRGEVSLKIAHYSLCTKSLVVTSECPGSGPVNRTFSKVRGSTPHGYEPSFCTLNSSRGTMPHHRANPLVPHLLTVRVTFIYWMNYYNFVGYPTTLIDHPQRLPAYDEGLYPDPKNKPTGRRFKNKGRRVNYPSQRNQVLT
jgi:hypothetical protein